MESKIRLKMSDFPKMISHLSHSNQFLKVFSFSLTGVSMLLIMLAVLLGTKEPTILTLAPNAQVLERRPPPKLEDEIQEAIKAYIDLRYKWEPSSVVKNLKSAEAFVFPSSMKAYQAAANNVSRFSIEKSVSQRVYSDKMNVNLEKRTVLITGDRLTSIQGIRAAGDLRLELSFESGPRTRENPWGIYISKEKEE